ncbi:hypothetical protein PGT21_006043 [Puccinia graminis f. sp. tritici]|uniref:Uncharacterized protein n=1 Tax=Puccinia graminis f. sp. tritici TaxID=56615 RepID=A0A5B0NJQ9_PUCGR|nr:hypothetical protein PGTUg99_025903 [Puccinia graminis f. sp. tritici]KAA1105399.1 hypothetical protein PGT21_006043 [Puccinia graminis f. sp. tritici]
MIPNSMQMIRSVGASAPSLPTPIHCFTIPGQTREDADAFFTAMRATVYWNSKCSRSNLKVLSVAPSGKWGRVNPGPTRDPRGYEAGSGRSLGNVDLTRTDPACSQVGFGQVLQTSGQPRVDPKTRLGSRGPRVRTQGRVRIRDNYRPKC